MSVGSHFHHGEIPKGINLPSNFFFIFQKEKLLKLWHQLQPQKGAVTHLAYLGRSFAYELVKSPLLNLHTFKLGVAVVRTGQQQSQKQPQKSCLKQHLGQHWL